MLINGAVVVVQVRAARIRRVRPRRRNRLNLRRLPVVCFRALSAALSSLHPLLSSLLTTRRVEFEHAERYSERESNRAEMALS